MSDDPYAGWERYQVTLPEGSVGGWTVFRDVMTVPDPPRPPDGAGWPPAPPRPGEYTALYSPLGVVAMYDAFTIVSQHWELFGQLRRLGGRVLLNGLGLGLDLKAALETPGVTHVDVVEREPDVLELVAPHYDDPRVTFHLADAFEFAERRELRTARWHVVWHDIWPVTPLDEAERLERAYAPRARWQGTWARRRAELLARRR